MTLPWLNTQFKDKELAPKLPSYNIHFKAANPSGNQSKISSTLRHRYFSRLFNKKAITIISILLLYTYTLLNTEYIYPQQLLNNTIKSINLLNEAEQALTKKDPMAALQSAIAETIQQDQFEDYVQEYPLEDLRSRLSRKYQYDRSSKIPKLIWQTWKEPLEKISNPNLLRFINSWESQQEFEYHLISDSELEGLVMELYIEFPEILDTLHRMPKNILKFDFLRYLILFAKGGIYSDIDTTNLTPSLLEWIDTSPELLSKYFDQSIASNNNNNNNNNKNIGFVVGIEGDYDRADWRYKMARRVQFCQWTFKSKIGHPILRELIYSIVETTLNNYNEKLNHVKIGSDYHTLHSIYTILNWTGPGIFTDVIFDHMNKIFKFAKIHNKNGEPIIKHTEFEYYHKERNSINIEDGKFLGWNNFTKLSQPVLYDDVLILPINSFNAFNDQMEIQPDEQLTYVKHDFSGTWKLM